MEPVNLEDSFAYLIHVSARLLRRNFLHIAQEGGFELQPEQWFIINKLKKKNGQKKL